MVTKLGRTLYTYMRTETMACPECSTEIVVDIFLTQGELDYEINEGFNCPNDCGDCYENLLPWIEMVADEHGFLPA
jgi:hypothetical protein